MSPSPLPRPLPRLPGRSPLPSPIGPGTPMMGSGGPGGPGGLMPSGGMMPPGPPPPSPNAMGIPPRLGPPPPPGMGATPTPSPSGGGSAGTGGDGGQDTKESAGYLNRPGRCGSCDYFLPADSSAPASLASCTQVNPDSPGDDPNEISPMGICKWFKEKETPEEESAEGVGGEALEAGPAIPKGPPTR